MADLKAFNEELKKKNFRGYWQAERGEVAREPVSTFGPCLWKGKDLYELIGKAGEVVGMKDTFRRVIQMSHPELPTGTTHTLTLNLQMLKPGERAAAHRHMAGAIRFITRGRGARLIVEGESFEIGAGDFATTPNWTWHDHVNESNETLTWLDVLDSPLVRTLQVDFHEPYGAPEQPITRAEGTSYAELGPLRPSWVRPDSVQPPPYVYRWEDTERALQNAGERPGDPCDGIVLEYVNPLTGGPTLPTFSCAIQMLRPGEKTLAHRHTSSTIYHVFKGAGTSVIGDALYDWEEGDSFVAPLWHPHRHENRHDRPAILFTMTDRPLMEALGWYRERREEST
ncbi:MAG TPA: cupin domain-containing protein [Candidatus Binatia bacterium]